MSSPGPYPMLRFRTLHKCPMHDTHPMFRDQPENQKWEVCKMDCDCARWPHKTQARIEYEPTAWADVKEEN